MRICIVTIAAYVHGIGGMQRHTSELARGLAEAGHEVEVITTRDPAGRQTATHEGAFWRFVDSSGDQVDRGWHRASLAAFRESHAQKPFELIHSESTSALGLVRAGEHRRVPLAVKYHGNFLGQARANVRRATRDRTPRAVAREAKSFVWLCGQHFPRGNWWRFHEFHSMVPSRQQIEDQRRSHFIPRHRIHVVPNGVDTAMFRPNRAAARAKLGLDESESLVVAAGRLSHDKGMHTAIEALARTAVPARLVIVGDGPERGRLEQLSRSLGVADRVRVTGAQAPETVADYLAASDVFLFPTERDEAAPMILIEAMASGTPVVASRIDQVAEVIDRPGENGILVTVADVDAVAATITTLTTDADGAARIGQNGRERILEEYTVERMIERTVAVYDRAVADHRSAAT
jgi:glycosyltransferase involved in cell wall biosynthesis